MAHLSLSLLGPFQATLDGAPLAGIEANKVRALLAYLAVEAGQHPDGDLRPHPRTVLATLLWPDRPERAALASLRNALANLRQAIGDRDATPPFLLITRETIQFNPTSDHWLDVAAFRALVETTGADQPSDRRLEEAVALYRGDFLQGFSVRGSPDFEGWALLVRERLQRQALAALRGLMAHYESNGEVGRACEVAWRQVELAPWEEEAHQRLMRLLALSGDRSAALAQYEACRRALAEELGVEPSAETTRLYKEIRDGELAVTRTTGDRRTTEDRRATGADRPAVTPTPEGPRRVEGASEAVQEIPLLTTKLYAPPPRPGPVPRPRLTQRLNEGLTRKLTLISAPAGFGKTTLIGEWRSAPPAGELPCAWVSLDGEDNEPTRFWTYVVAALGRVQEDLGAGVLPMLRAPQPPPMRSILTALINEFAALPHDCLLVLDDYHLIQAEAIHEALAFLLDHTPPQLHLVIASRTDPPLPLSGLRGRGQLVELHQRHLRFTADEAAAFLNQVMGLDLSAEQVTALEGRTESWIVGLQMAALSLRGREEGRVADFIAAFSGSHRYVVDYLVEQVLVRQTERVQDFLLRTSVLNRMCGPLCDALTGQGDGQATLEWMEGANLFTIPLDDERLWYRYHHLFSDVLRGRLRGEDPERVPELHRRASGWYAEHRLSEEAVSHAFAAEDWELAADLIEANLERMTNDLIDFTTVPTWLEALPEEVVRSRPWLCIWHAMMMLVAPSDSDPFERLRDAERLLSAEADRVGDDAQASAQVRRLLGWVAAARVYHLARRGDLPQTMEQARKARKLLPEDDKVLRPGVGTRVGMAHLHTGDALAAERAYLEVGEQMNLAHFAGATWSSVLERRGRLRQAAEVCREGLQILRDTRKGARVPGTGGRLDRLARVSYEWNELDDAIPPLMRGIECASQLDEWYRLAEFYLQVAWVYRAQGDVNRAAEALEKVTQLLPRLDEDDSRHVRAVQARLRLAQGELEAVVPWAQALGLSLDEPFTYGWTGLVEVLTLVRVRIAQSRNGAPEADLDGVLRFLIQRGEQAEAHGRMWNLIEILVLHALARQVQEDVEGALAALVRALSLAEPEGYVRTFVDEGLPMAELLRLAAARGISPGYVSKLLAAYGEEAAAVAPAGQPPVEQLSERELEVLGLLAEGLANLEIAQALSVTVGTVKTYAQNIYGKLGTRNRTLAVARARELGLLEL